MMNRACYVGQTETLTEKGWKLYTDVLPGEKIATVNPKTGELEYQLPKAIHVYPFDGDIQKIKTQNVDVRVTPEHDIWMRIPEGGRRNSVYAKRKASKLPGSFHVLAAVQPEKVAKQLKMFSIPRIDTFHEKDHQGVASPDE